MFKKGLAAIVCLVVLTAAWSWAATAWQLQTKLSNAGGTLQVRDQAPQTVVGSVVYTNYTTSNPVRVAVTEKTGYTITKVTKSGVLQGITHPTTNVDVVKIGTTAQSVVATFAAQQFTVTGAVVGAGTITPSSATVAYNGTVVFSSSPSNGYSILTAVDGVPAAAVKDLGGNVVTLPYNGPVKITVSPVQAAVAITATYSTVSVSAGANAVAATAVPVYLTGAYVGAGTTLWTQVSGPETVTINNATALRANFTAATAGVYVFQLTESLRGNSSTTQVTLTGDLKGYVKSACDGCHNATNGVLPSTAFNLWSTSIHRVGNVSCISCHTDGAMPTPVNTNTVNGDNMQVLNASAGTIGTVFCVKCHTGAYPIPHNVNVLPGITCEKCHTDPLGQNTGSGGPHGIQPLPKCIQCHAVQQPQVAANMVNDNAGVRNIAQEFTKWSHHVTGVTLDDAHCAACHLEGKVQGTEIVVDGTKHMVDANIHLRNVHDDTEYLWNPETPNHSNMDNFCMTCHSATGATSTVSQAIQAYINTNSLNATGKTASALNPFGDTISNRYDKMQRPAVTNVDNQFNTTNNSHHAVKGPRYTGRTRTAGARQILAPTTFANNSSALLQGTRSTIYDAGNFNQLYTPLANNGGEVAPRTGAATLGDDSTLHCGDCHTVGQWKANSTVNAAGVANTVAIGAHGSNNEYLLRNSIGSDERHAQNSFLTGNAAGTVLNPTTGLAIPNGVVLITNPDAGFLVCYNCHAFQKYGSAFASTGVNGPHAGEYATAGRCNGPGNTLPFNGYTTGNATDGTQFAGRLAVSFAADGKTANGVLVYGQNPASTPGFPLNGTAPAGQVSGEFGNVFGIQCANCHNSGLGNGYGGIHGSANNTGTTNGLVSGGAFLDGMGNTNKVERFLPGLGNAAYVPGTLGGVTGGTTAGPVTNSTFVYTYATGGTVNDTNWEQKHWNQTATTVINYVKDANGKIIAGAGSVSTGATIARAGAGCYTLGAGGAASTLTGPSVTGATGPVTAGLDTWGGCDDHAGAQGKGDHGFIKQIVRPITY